MSPDLGDDTSPDVAALLLESVSFWVRECIVRARLTPPALRCHLVVSPGPAEAWTRLADDTTAERPVFSVHADSTINLRFTDLFVARLQEEANVAERHLVAVLLTDLFSVDAPDVNALVEMVAPLGPKRMLNAFNENDTPDMRSERLPAPLTGHRQITAQLLDELGEWLRDPSGADLPVGPLKGGARSEVLNRAVGHLFVLMETEVARYDQQSLLEYLVAQNEALTHFAKHNSRMLRSRLACFGAGAETTKELVRHRSENATAQRANRFLIEYVAAQPPLGGLRPTAQGYHRLLGVAQEVIERGTASDFLYYGLADFDVSILKSGRLGMSRDQPVDKAIKTYAEAASAREIRAATHPPPDNVKVAPGSDMVNESADAMRSEYGFTLADLCEVCGALLDLGTADQVTRIDRVDALAYAATSRNLDPGVADTVLKAITLTARDSFLAIGSDAHPWRFNRNMSYVRRPLILQGDQLVFGFRSVFNTGPYWFSCLTSGRLQANAKSQVMKAYISEARGGINDGCAADVAERLRRFGLTTELSVRKIGGVRIADPDGLDLGDIDILAWHPESRTVLAVEAKDFEIARTPAEMSHEIAKLFKGKEGKEGEKVERSTVDKHARRVDWLSANIGPVLTHVGADASPGDSTVVGVVVTSDPLVTPLVESSALPVIAFDDLDLDVLGLDPTPARTHGRPRRRTG